MPLWHRFRPFGVTFLFLPLPLLTLIAAVVTLISCDLLSLHDDRKVLPLFTSRSLIVFYICVVDCWYIQTKLEGLQLEVWSWVEFKCFNIFLNIVDGLYFLFVWWIVDISKPNLNAFNWKCGHEPNVNVSQMYILNWTQDNTLNTRQLGNYLYMKIDKAANTKK